MGTQGGFYTHTRVRQGLPNATGHFQASMEHEGLDAMIEEECLACVNDIIIRGRTPRDLLLKMLKVMR